MPQNSDTSSVQPIVAASEKTPVIGQRDGREESQRYQGVQKIKNRPIYVGHVIENDDAAQNNKKITYLGKYDKEEDAARAHDLMTLKIHGSGAQTNFPESDYKEALEAMTNMTQTEVVAIVRRLSATFWKSISTYHGVTRHVTGKWQATYGIDNKSRSLGLFDSEKDAARAYDVESIRVRGYKALTNFDIKNYNVRAILNGETDEEDIYHTVEPIEPVEVLRQKNIGTPKLPHDTGIRIGDGAGPQIERLMPIVVSSRSIEDQQANVALVSSVQHDDCDTTLSLAIKRPAMDSSKEGGGEGSSSALCFLHASSSAFKGFKKRRVDDEPAEQVEVTGEVQKDVN